MKLPLSVLMYQVSDDYDYETVNVDVSSAYDGIKLFDEGAQESGEEKYLYLIDAKDLEELYSSYRYSRILSASVFICLCSDQTSSVKATCSELSVVYLYTTEKFAYIFNRMQNIVKRFDTWEKSFHLSLLRQNSMQDLIDITDELLTHPLIVMDNSYGIIGHTSESDEIEEDIRKIIDNGYASPSELQHLQSRGIISDFDSFDSPEINRYINEQGGTNYSIMYKFISMGRIIGYALAVHCNSHPTDGYLYLMNMIAEKLQLFFDQRQTGDSSSEEGYQTFLTGLMDNPDVSLKQLREQAGHIQGLETDGVFMLMQIQYNRMTDMSSTFVSWSLRNTINGCMPFIYRDNFYILKDNTKSKEQLRIFDDDEFAELLKCFRGIGFVCGVSKPFFSMTGLRNAATQCREAISIGTALSSSHESGLLSDTVTRNQYSDASANQVIYDYSSTAFYHMLVQLRKVMPAEMTESAHYHLLHEYDAEHSSDLCDVFMQYLLHGCSITRTAASTYMHRNTILNKVKKSVEIMENEMDDFQTMLFFIISYLQDKSSIFR